MTDQVLVLNKNYQAINIVPAWKALSMIFRERAEIVYVEDGYYQNYNLQSWYGFTEMRLAEGIDEHDGVVKGLEKEVIVPKVIRTLFFDKIPIRKVILTRKNIYLRDNFTCMYCGKKFHPENINLDHVIPKSKGGRMVWENVVCSCIKCNVKKGSLSLEESGMKLLRKPYVPRYNFSVYEKCKEPKYKPWRDFVSDTYWNVPLKE
jgi:5-methylcytosine-specific restriction endonuclease McrA